MDNRKKQRLHQHLRETRRSPTSSEPEWRRRENELLERSLDIEDATQTLVGCWRPNISDGHFRAAGGYSTVTTIELDDHATLEISASWTLDHLDLSWASHGIALSSYLVVVFRSTMDGRLLNPPEVVGRLDQRSWAATADELGFQLDERWELVAMIICDR